MKYVQPVGGLADDPYLDANPVGGIEGSPVPAAAIEHPMRELVALITDAGLTPTDADLTQVATAIKTIFQKASATSAAASGTVDAITADYTPEIAALTDHMLLIVRASGANTSTTPSFTPKSATIPAKTIVKGHNQALVAGDISGAGFRAELQYDVTLGKWVLLNPATGVVSSGGELLRITRYVAAGSGTWTKQSDTNSILVRAVAGGGGGGGAVSGSNQSGNGGYSGCYGVKLITAPAASYSYVVGAAGSGGAVGVAGSAGGQTSFGAMTLTGGPGGQMALGAFVALPTGSGWDFTSASSGALGTQDSTGNVHSVGGHGGPSPFAGGGGQMGAGSLTGTYGSGGGGGSRPSGVAAAGTNGGPGYIEVWEYA